MNYLYVANWKMYASLNESINFCLQNYTALKEISYNNKIIICPSFVALAQLTELFKNSTIAIGAQNCSEYPAGPYTGEVSAQMLTQSGVTYCIVGHSERRTGFGELPDSIAKKITLLYHNNIQPIICIGETKKEDNTSILFTILAQQLESIIQSIPKNSHILIAYEPTWSIGSGVIPDMQELKKIFSGLRTLLATKLPDNTPQLLYGGSVNPENIHDLKKIPHIDGFLIGKASTDFDSFSKIIN